MRMQAATSWGQDACWGQTQGAHAERKEQHAGRECRLPGAPFHFPPFSITGSGRGAREAHPAIAGVGGRPQVEPLGVDPQQLGRQEVVNAGPCSKAGNAGHVNGTVLVEAVHAARRTLPHAIRGRCSVFLRRSGKGFTSGPHGVTRRDRCGLAPVHRRYNCHTVLDWSRGLCTPLTR